MNSLAKGRLNFPMLKKSSTAATTVNKLLEAKEQFLRIKNFWKENKIGNLFSLVMPVTIAFSP
jgi:hypothetical protein